MSNSTTTAGCVWPVCSLLFGRGSHCEARGGSASNSKNKRTTERGIKLVCLIFQRTSRRNFAKYCILTVVSCVMLLRLSEIVVPSSIVCVCLIAWLMSKSISPIVPYVLLHSYELDPS